jgi:glycosyltransferase involved in cell wall biosynthesis
MHGARNVGGGENSIYLLIKNLRRDIFEPIVFYSHENKIIRRLREDGIQLINIPLNEKITSVYRDEIEKNPASLFSYVRYLIAGVFKVVRSLKKYKVDILHPHDNLSKIIGGVAAKIAGVKVVAHCRDLLKESLIEKMLIFYQLLFIDKIITVSESNRRLFKIGRKIPNKVHTIYNGIDLSRFDSVTRDCISIREELGISNERFVVGIIGVFDKCKGHIYLFQAIEKLVSHGVKDIMCLVVGDGREREELKGFIINKGLQDYFMFLGYRSDIPELLKAIDVIVMPSIQESFPRVPLEAMAMHVPVIATTVGGLPESIDDSRTGILVPPGDAASLSRAIKYLIDNPDIREEMGRAGRQMVEERFSLESNIKKTEELYLSILKHKCAVYVEHTA